MIGFVVTQTSNTVTTSTVGASLTFPTTDTDALQIGSTVVVDKRLAPGLGKATILITAINTNVSIVGTWLGATGDVAPGASVGSGAMVVLVSDVDFQSCDVDALLRQSGCFAGNCMSETVIQGIALYLLVAQLAAAGGTDYSSSVTSLSIAAAKWKSLVDYQRQQIKLYETLQNALLSGASVSSDASTLEIAAAGYLNMSSEAQKNLLAYLKCLLNTRGLPAW